MGSNRRGRRAARFGNRQPTRMTEYQRARQTEAPRGEVKVHAHLHGLDVNAAAELDEAGAFEGLPCGNGCGQAVEWSTERDLWQHHATKAARCRGARGEATPPDWYTGEPGIDDAFEDPADDDPAEDLTAHHHDIGDFSDVDTSDADTAPAKPPRVDGNPYDTEFARGVLKGLQDKPIYPQSVQPDEIERRRLRNRDANRARRANRRARVKHAPARHRVVS